MTKKKQFIIMTNFLKNLKLHHVLLSDEISVLDIPKDLETIVLDECKKLNLMLCYNITEKAVYEGFFRGEQNLVKFADRIKTITIKEPVPDWDCSEIFYTVKRIM